MSARHDVQRTRWHVTCSDAVLRYEKTDFQKAVAAKFASLEGLGNWKRVEADRSVEDVHVIAAHDGGGGGVW